MIVTYLLIGPKQFRRNVLPKRDSKGRFVGAKPKTPAIEKNPFAEFYYPMSSQPWNSSYRKVRVISSTANYLTGLEQDPNTFHWQYKKFCQSKIKFLKFFFNEGAMR